MTTWPTLCVAAVHLCNRPVLFLHFCVPLPRSYNIHVFMGYNMAGGEIVLWCLDIITIAVPAALVVCLTVTTACMLLRLRRKGLVVTVGVGMGRMPCVREMLW